MKISSLYVRLVIISWCVTSFYTVGHSTRPFKEFLELLAPHRLARLVDVRTVPRSARNPQYNREWLPAALAPSKIAYTHLPALGGLRHPRKDSINTGWHNDSFRGYADYMQTAEFEQALDELVMLADRERIVIMCAEALPWRCHRSLIADAAVARGIEVAHIMNGGVLKPHALTFFAKVDNGRVRYPGSQQALPFGN